jgi:hypothetical protein
MLALQSAAGEFVSQQEINAVRALLTSQPRPVGWSERRARIDEIGSTWPIADDVRLEEVEFNGVPAEWSIVPGSDPSHDHADQPVACVRRGGARLRLACFPLDRPDDDGRFA